MRRTEVKAAGRNFAFKIAAESLQRHAVAVLGLGPGLLQSLSFVVTHDFFCKNNTNI